MPSVWKDIFRPGRYRDSDGEWHTFTSADTISAFHNGRKLLNSPYPFSVPLIWEHDWSAVPMPRAKMLSALAVDRDKRAQYARNTFGHIEDFDLRYEPDPKRPEVQRPVLWSLNHIPDERDLAQWHKVRYCSPRVDFGFKHPMGGRYEGCSVMHLAAVSQPVQIDQKPVMLGLDRPSLRTFFLGAAMAKDGDGDGKKGEGDDKADSPQKADKPAGGNTDGAMMSRLKAACAKMGCPIPDSATDLDDVVLCMETHAMNGGANGNANDGNGLLEEDEAPVAGAGGGLTAMLSQLPAEEREQVEKEIKFAKDQYETAVGRERAVLIERLNKVERPAVESGIATPIEVNSLRQRLNTVNLSFTPDHKVSRNAAIKELEVWERQVARGKADGKAGTGPKPPAKVRQVNMSVIPAGGGGGMVHGGPIFGTPEWDEAIEAAKREAADRVCPLPDKK